MDTKSANEKPNTTITIRLTDRSPVRIDKTRWYLVASASWHDGKVECQANRRAWIKVRRHDDGRTIVYGLSDSNWAHERSVHAGYLVPADAGEEGDVAAIRRVADEIGHPELGLECIQDLPAEDLDE